MTRALPPALLAALAAVLLAPGLASAGIVTGTVEGSGTIAATVQGVSGTAFCPPQCEAAIPDGTAVQLTATPDPRATFLGWGGACAGATGNRCDLVVAGDMALSARFSVPPPLPPEPEPPADAGLEDVTVAGALPPCRAPPGGSCSERLAGVLRDGRLLMVRETFGAGRRSRVRTTLRAVTPAGGGARELAAIAGAVETTRLSTDRGAVILRVLADKVVRAVLVPSGRSRTYRPGIRVRTEALHDVFDRAGGRLMVVAARDIVRRGQVLRANDIVVGPLAGGPRRRIAGGSDGGVAGARLSPDGRRVALIARGRIVVAPVNGSRRRTVTPASSAPDDGRWLPGGIAPGARMDWQVISLAWSRDGTRIAAAVSLFGARGATSAIVTVRPDGTDLRPVVVPAGAVGHLDWRPDGGIAFQASLLTDPHGSVQAIGLVEPSGAVSYLRQPGAAPLT